MKLTLDLSCKYLKRLPIIILMYCTGITAKTEKYCQWNYCEPIHVEKKWSWWRGWQKTTKYFGRQRGTELAREYTNNDLSKIRDECNEWRGQWPLNCPMKLVGNIDKMWTHQNLMWTNELLEDINKYRSSSIYKLPSLTCRVPVGIYNIGFFGEAIFNYGAALGNTYANCSDVGFLIKPFLGTDPTLAAAIENYHFGIIDWLKIKNHMVKNNPQANWKENLFNLISRDPDVLKESSLLFAPFLQSTVIMNNIYQSDYKPLSFEYWIGPTNRKQQIELVGGRAGKVPYSEIAWSIDGMHRPGSENWYNNMSNYIHWF
jgi:hypothetical protein